VICLSLDDLRALLRAGGPGSLGIGEGTGEGRAVAAMQQAAASPLLDSTMGEWVQVAV